MYRLAPKYGVKYHLPLLKCRRSCQLHYKIINVQNISLPLLQCRCSCQLHYKIINVWSTSLSLLQCRRSCQYFCSTPTVLFSHVVESWKCTNTRNLWLRRQNPCPHWSLESQSQLWFRATQTWRINRPVYGGRTTT